MKLSTQYIAMKFLDENRARVAGKTANQIRSLVCDEVVHVSSGQVRRYCHMLGIEIANANKGGLTSRIKALATEVDALQAEVSTLNNTVRSLEALVHAVRTGEV